MAAASNSWLTDSRVYNLIWLGRWLERAEGVSRAVNSAARVAISSPGGEPEAAEETGEARVGGANGSDNESMARALLPVANTLGISVGDPSGLAADILLRNARSSALHCLSSARLNATQVAPVELIRAIGQAIMDLEEVAPESLASPFRVIAVTDQIGARIAGIYEAIEDRWFGQESLTEEEVFRRFVQQ